MIDVVLVQEAVRDLPGAGQAWVVLTACLVDQLRAGYDGTKESGGQKNSVGNPPSCPIFYGQKKSIIHQDEDEHIYVNFPPEKERDSPICPYSNSPKHNSKQNSPQSGSPRQHTPRQLPEEPGSPFDNRRPSFTLMVDNAVDPIR
uniref:Uncharacterized protein n=1 Tax=Panagrolaimus sp. JU765 TaxID=591449 RepID=A0AC34R892_9BILA